MNQVEGHSVSLTIGNPFQDEVDEAAHDAIEVKVLWGDDIVHVVHVTSADAFTVGDSGCSFALPAEIVGAARLALVFGRGGRLWLALPPGATGTLSARGGEAAHTVAELVSVGDAAPSRQVPGAHELALDAGAKGRIELLAVRVAFEIAHVRAGKRAPVGLLSSVSSEGHAYTGMSALMHGALIASLAFFLPAMKGTDGETIDRDQAAAMAPYLTAIAEREQEPHDNPAEAASSKDQNGGTGGAARGESGTLGSQVAPARTDARYAVKGLPDNVDPRIARERALQEVETFGMIPILEGSTMNAPIAAWGAHDASGKDPKSALGNMWGLTLDDALGVGGLGLSGAGVAGGGQCEGCVGLGEIGGLGHGLGDGTGASIGNGDGSGHGHGVLPSTYTPKGMRMRVGVTEVAGGRIPAEVIQRIVRQNFGRFRMCYENGLRANPSLSGRVAVKFIIDRHGAVSLAADAGSDLPDQAVIGCVVRGFSGLSFPEPQGGVVKVTYPIAFAPGE